MRGDILIGVNDWNENIVQVYLWQLLQWRAALKLEEKGLKHSRGSVMATVRKRLGAPASYSRREAIRYFDAVISDVKEQMGVG